MDFENQFQRLAQAVDQITIVEDLWKSIKEDLLASLDATCGWSEELPSHRVTWWQSFNVDIAVKEKCQF